MNGEVLGRYDYGQSDHSCNSTVLKEKKKDKTLLLGKYGTGLNKERDEVSDRNNLTDYCSGTKILVFS